MDNRVKTHLDVVKGLLSKEAGRSPGLLKTFLKDEMPLFHGMGDNARKGLLTKTPKVYSAAEAVGRGLASSVEGNTGLDRAIPNIRVNPDISTSGASYPIKKLFAEALTRSHRDAYMFTPHVHSVRALNHTDGVAQDYAKEMLARFLRPASQEGGKNWQNIFFSKKEPWPSYGDAGIVTTPSRVKNSTPLISLHGGDAVAAGSKYIPGDAQDALSGKLMLPSAEGKIYYNPTKENADFAREMINQHGRHNVIPYNKRTRNIIKQHSKNVELPDYDLEKGNVSLDRLSQRYPGYANDKTTAQQIRALMDKVYGISDKTAAGRCWEGYKPVPGKEPYSNDSCEPVGAKKKKESELEKAASSASRRIMEMLKNSSSEKRNILVQKLNDYAIKAKTLESQNLLNSGNISEQGIFSVFNPQKNVKMPHMGSKDNLKNVLSFFDRNKGVVAQYPTKQEGLGELIFTPHLRTHEDSARRAFLSAGTKHLTPEEQLYETVIHKGNITDPTKKLKATKYFIPSSAGGRGISVKELPTASEGYMYKGGPAARIRSSRNLNKAQDSDGVFFSGLPGVASEYTNPLRMQTPRLIPANFSDLKKHLRSSRMSPEQLQLKTDKVYDNFTKFISPISTAEISKTADLKKEALGNRAARRIAAMLERLPQNSESRENVINTLINYKGARNRNIPENLLRRTPEGKLYQAHNTGKAVPERIAQVPASHEFEVLKHKLDPSYALNPAKYLGKQADDEEQDLIDDARLKRRFKYWATKMRNHGVMAGTYHKRIAIPKFRLTENHLRRLGFEPVAIAIPEAGQDEFASYRNPHNLFHLHSHGKHWTMHEDEHPSLTMALRGAPIEEVPAAIVSGLSHIVTEGLPGAYKYISHRLTGAGNMLDAVMNETAAKQKNNNTIDAIEPEAA